MLSMIIEKKELEKLQKAIEAEEKALNAGDFEHKSPGNSYLHRNPHLLLLLGYDEYKVLRESLKNIEFLEQYIGQSAAFPTKYESIYRSEDSGEWQLFQGLMRKGHGSPLYCHFKRSFFEHRRVPCDKLLKRIQETIETPHQSTSSIILPSIWLPERQIATEIQLVESTRSIISTISSEGESLSSIPWRQLEEIVAELLRERGLEIHVTRRTRDGGRDIIARGELIPGEPMLLAVEVKQKPIVGIEDVQRALRANEDFPGLLVATSGRFSAGVVAEKKRNRNALRLFLKDGVALKQWITAYTRRGSV
jgi:HJR/Mrr/RecB family endonuclease